MTDTEILDEFEERLMRAVDTLETMRSDAMIDTEQVRLSGKKEGAQLALSYLREYRRMQAAR